MRFLWQEAPLLKILLPFGSGIILYSIFPSIPLQICCWLFVGISLSTFGIHFLPAYLRYTYQWVAGVLLQFACVVFGFGLIQLRQIPINPLWYLHQSSTYKYMRIIVDELPEEKEKTIKIIGQVTTLLDSASAKHVVGTCIFYFEKEVNSKLLQLGDGIIVKQKCKPVQQTTNPGAFNYANYLKTKQIYQTSYLRANDWCKESRIQPRWLDIFPRMSIAIRKILQQFIHHPQSLAFAEALLIGYRHNIDDTVYQAYTKTGLAHIIAISGMHMAMIYMSLLYIFTHLPFLKRYRRANILLALLCMWIFAAIIGFPPSVCRAAMMFTSLGIGEMISKNISPFNNLAASAFVLLCIQPNWLLDVGFQLSYIAVLSLLLFYTSFVKLLIVPHFFLSCIWKLITATVAAQILTTPICLYYFHQFPVLFLVSNLIAVPATTLLLYSEILLLFLSPCTKIASVLGDVISITIQWLHTCILSISSWRFAVWNSIHLNILEVLLLYVFLFLLMLWWSQKQTKWLLVSCSILLIFISGCCWQRFEKVRQHVFIVYDIPKVSTIEFISGEKYFTPDTSTFRLNAKFENYVRKPSHQMYGCSRMDSTILRLCKKADAELFLFEHVKILRLSNAAIHWKKRVTVDYVILTNRMKFIPASIVDSVCCKKIILDSSIPIWKVKKVAKVLRDKHFEVYSCTEKGAFICSF